MPIEEGIPAPDFTLMDETETPRSLHEFRGNVIVLYFYPKDDTPGCTVEACNFRNDFSEYEKAGVKILGISPDSAKSHAKFKQKHNLPFILLADVDHHVCELYGVWGTKKNYGKEYQGVFRTTFLIGTDGNVLRVFKNVKPEGHSQEILSNIRS